jgi:protein-S-isoprenylcysteine O-methyltransferase Ste14
MIVLLRCSGVSIGRRDERDRWVEASIFRLAGGRPHVTLPGVTTDPPRVATRPQPVVTFVFALLVAALDALLLMLALGGPAALLAHRRALALLAAWTMGGVTLALLRPVRDQDVVERAGESPAVLILLLLVPLTAAPLAALSERQGWWLLPGGEPLRWTGVALSALGLALRIAAMRQLGPRFSPRIAVQRDHALETRGLYGWVRHPGYLGAWLVAVGGTLAFGGGVALPLVLLMGLLLHNRAIREESLLEDRFGDGFRRYRDRTGRFLPRMIRKAG